MGQPKQTCYVFSQRAERSIKGFYCMDRPRQGFTCLERFLSVNGPVWFGCGFLKAAVKNLLWENSCGKSDVKKM